MIGLRNAIAVSVANSHAECYRFNRTYTLDYLLSALDHSRADNREEEREKTLVMSPVIRAFVSLVHLFFF